ncbi:hypothetical protein RIR_jg2949.t1 [Rhizophagus irregularis DAOM 181602=DAOM 197198]|nr:hypothetical protein RIR_jg2949.t1 [Rhizophagus irregularis DAOM 181602=DAOM 197198]
MLTNRTSKKHSRSEDNYNIDYIYVDLPSWKHKIYEHSTPLTATSSLKQVKIDRYIISSDSSPQMTQDQQK